MRLSRQRCGTFFLPRSALLARGHRSAFRVLALHTAAREGLLCPTYCLMPDHIHLIWMGLRLDTDQLNGMAFFRTHLEPELSTAKFQHQAQEHALKENERRHDAFARACHYILENPLQAGLVAYPNEWPHSGAVVPGYPTLHPLQDGFWKKLRKIYKAKKAPDAGNILRPPLS